MGLHFFESIKRFIRNITPKSFHRCRCKCIQALRNGAFPYSPTSELVWSENEGVSIRYTPATELGKVSLFWSTESFNIVIPSTNNLTKEERMQLHVISEMAGSKNNAGLSVARRSLSDVLPVSLVRRHAKDSRSCGQVNFTNQLNPGHAQVRMSAENLEKDEESSNSTLKRIAKVSHEKGPANDGVSISNFQPFCSYQENFKENDQIASSSSMGFLPEILQDGGKLILKGKEKVACEKDHAAKESDDSNESVESTSSMVSKRKRPWLFSNNLNNSGLKSKKLKSEGNESSFVNWISTIVNGFASSSQPALVAPLSVAKQQPTDENGPSSSTPMSYENHPKTFMPFKPMGFSSLFHALYRHNNTIGLYGSKRESFSLEKSSQNEDNCGLNANHTNPSQDEVRPNNQNDGRACLLQTTDQFNSASNNESRSSEEKSRDTNGRYLDNFWITRLLPKEASSSQSPIKNDAIDLNREANDHFDEKTDQKLKSNFNLIQPSSKSKESKAIVSLFARRLGAIKHAKPLNCKNQGDMEDKMEFSNSPNKDRRMILWLGDRDENANEANRGRNIGSMEVGSSSADRGGTNENSAMLKPNVFVHVANEETVAISEAVRRLRLSRTDVMRWMKLHIQQATLDGFFLRLRLGKLNGAVGRSGYYVARINGLSGEKRLSVSIGKLSCIVEFHCISNQDFLEDELKDWFNAALKGDFRLPSREELDGKLKERDLVVKN